MAITKSTRSTFGVKQHFFPIPDLNETQVNSYNHFWDTGLAKILEEIGTIEDSNGRWKVSFGPHFNLQKSESGDEFEALISRKTYSAKLMIDVVVENVLTKEKKRQEVFAGNVPLMTRKGNFIINGIQKIIVNQLIKAPGLIYTRELEKGIFEYTAKIIPNRGGWLEFTLSYDGAIYCRIDRKKKFPATQILKIFGMTEETILADFEDLEEGQKVKYITKTLEKDPTFTVAECVNSIYKKIRPGDIVSIDKGLKYITNIIEDPNKYDFGNVGRYKFDMRLNHKSVHSETEEYKRTLDAKEIVLVLQELIKMAQNNQESDAIDSLSNRRIRRVGEWMGNTFRSGLYRVIKNIKDKLSVSEDNNFTPAGLVNMRPLATMVEDFFNTSQLSRFMDQINVLSEIDQRHFMTCSGPGGLTRERAGFDVRDVQPSYYGRVCPVNTPEGPAFGINLHTAIYTRANEMGFLETPYLVVKDTLLSDSEELIGRSALEDISINGKRILKSGQFIAKNVWEELQNLPKPVEVKVRKFVSKEIQWLASEEEYRYIIAEHINELDEQDHILIASMGARRSGVPSQASSEEIDFMDVASTQILSLSTCMIPFTAQTDGLRVQMGTNQQGQALPLVRPEQPIVATGFESVVARDGGYVVFAPCDGVVSFSDGKKVVIDNPSGKKHNYSTIKFYPSNDHSTINQTVRVKFGEKVKKGDILIEGFGVKNGEFAIGQNVKVAFMPFKGYNFEDAIVLSERLVQGDKFTSTHIYELICDVHETRIGNEEITRDIPNVSLEKLKKLDETGVIHLGAYVESGDILVGKISPKGESDLSPEDKLIRVLFGEYSRDVKDSSLYLQHGLNGKVISIRSFSRENGHQLPNDVIKRVHIWLATTRKIKAGDKMAGRHGNKGVVSVILPVEDMPYLADGTPVDMVLNPLGALRRMNLGQILETHLGLVCEKLGTRAITQPLNEISIDTIQDELEKLGYPRDGKLDLWDGQSGVKYDRAVTVGNLYMNKLYHLVDDKMHARSTGPYSLITQQPLGGKSHSGGQRFGEMEVWALEAYGAAYALKEMLTIKSDDEVGRKDAFEKIVQEKQITESHLPSSFIVLANELTALGLKVNAKVIVSEDHKQKIDANLALSVDEGNLI